MPPTNVFRLPTKTLGNIVELFGFRLSLTRRTDLPALSDACSLYLDEKFRLGKKSTKTRMKYAATFKRLLAFMDAHFPGIRLDDIGKTHMQAFIDHRAAAGLGAWTIQTECVHVSALFNWIVEDKRWLSTNPMSRTEKPVPIQGVKPFLSADQANHLLERLTGVKHDVAYIYLRTGMRPGELLRSKDSYDWAPPIYSPENGMLIL